MADPKKYISVFNDGTNDLYIKDAEAQQAIIDLQQSVTSGMHYIGETSTELTDGATTSTLTPKSEGAMSKTTGFEAGDLVIYGELEFVWSGAKWKEFGSTGSLKSLAFKDASDIETAGSTSSKMVTDSVTGVSGSTSVTGVDGSTTVYGCGDNATVHDTPSLSTIDIYGCGDNATVHDTPTLNTSDIYGCGTDATVGSASAWNDGTLASMTYDESNEKLTFVAGTKPSLNITPTTVATKAASATAVGTSLSEGSAITVATKAASATSVGTGIVAGTAVTVATKAASATTVPVAASAATTVPVAASAATTVATGALANDGAGASVVTAVSTTIQNKPSV